MNVASVSPIAHRSEETVVGFDPAQRTWITAASTAQPFDKLPALSGVLTLSPEALREAAEDFGHVVHHPPSAVLKPGSAEDIAHMVRFARKHGLKIGPRGTGHTMYGQSQVAGGIVIDMRSLAKILSVDTDRAVVEAGALWHTVVIETLRHGRTPPVVVDYLELTVGGTLSVGGVSGNAYRHGVQLDNVLELEVVTGEGQQLTCSLTQHRDLFEAALGGQGQCGIIVRATLKLIPAPKQARQFDLIYPDATTLIRDELRLSDDGRFESLLAIVVPGENGQWIHILRCVSFCQSFSELDNAKLMDGLNIVRGAEKITDLTYYDYLNRMEPEMAELQRKNQFEFPHTWCDLFLPASKIEPFFAEVLRDTPPADIPPFFPVLLYTFKRSRLTRPLFRTPSEETFVLLDVLRTATSLQANAAEMLPLNRHFFDRARELGGTLYAISAIPLSPEDWKQIYGPAWDAFAAAKRRYDPDKVLTPGPNIFG
jgi:FAD/FMN-containing dehydrogenase